MTVPGPHVFLVYHKQGGAYGQRRYNYGIIIAERHRRPFVKGSGITMREADWKADFHLEIARVLYSVQWPRPPLDGEYIVLSELEANF